MSNNKVTFEDVLSSVDRLTSEQIDITSLSEEKIAKDVEKVIQSVRDKSGKREYKPVTCSVCGKTQKVDVIIIKGTPYCGEGSVPERAGPRTASIGGSFYLA